MDQHTVFGQGDDMMATQAAERVLGDDAAGQGQFTQVDGSTVVSEPASELNPYTIVIVEDNPALADVYKIRLELIGYKVFVGRDGQEGLEVIEREKPDLVLLDMMLPRVAGDEVLRRMRASEWGKDIRVFIISNLNEHDAPAGLRDLNIEGYAVKANLHDDQLDQLVEKILTPRGQESTSLETPDTVQR